jgi:flagellar biosynthesis chaperone FliJ
LAGAELQLRDPIIFFANKLCSLLEQAEDAASVVGQQTGIVTTDKPWLRKRWRESSPLEELTQRDETRFRADENRAADQTAKDDSSYKTGSTSEGQSS